ncbi:MAG: ParB/RepB/Spo0J family partition protein [Ruminococcus sp.]|nr:ParB/RepB/Spo0J family partition protein [Ruminococcus sp.]
MNYLSKSENRITEIPTIKIRPNKTQPRKIFDEDKLRDLAKSIEENGILQPLTVRKVSQSEYEIIAGERRLRASVLAGYSKVPCIVIKCNDRESAMLALLENLQRCDLGIFEEARGISRLIRRYGITQEQAAKKLGKSQSAIANKLRLLNLSYDEQDWIVQAGLSERHARALLRIYDQELRKEALSKIIAENLNVAQSEELIESLLYSYALPEKEKKGTRKIVIKDVRIFINTINKAVTTMQQAGIDAICKHKDSGDYIEYTVKIPKQQTERSA